MINEGFGGLRYKIWVFELFIILEYYNFICWFNMFEFLLNIVVLSLLVLNWFDVGKRILEGKYKILFDIDYCFVIYISY